MVLRNIVKIDEEKCDGCGDCVDACAEGAIKIIDGKAKLVSEIYCDGLGACIGHCPQDAITIEKRKSAEFDEDATKAHLAEEQRVQKQTGPGAPVLQKKRKTATFVCPGTKAAKLREKGKPAESGKEEVRSQLSHWPVQLKLVSPAAPYFANADLLLVADCVPFAMGDFHNKFLKGRSVAVGCPKLDDAEFYVEKLAQILKSNKLNSLAVIHMEVPCCFGLIEIAKKAVALAGVDMAFKDITVALDGSIKETQTQ